MATYIPGIDTYIPQYEPFQPDFKFAQSVLSARQDRYDTNYKALNDLYSKVVYADLSREDTRYIRDKFANDLTPTLNKIASLDLSIGQNIDQAKGVFNPFIENKLIQDDMFRTSLFRSQMRIGSGYMDSMDEDTRSKYWPEGLEYLNMQMQDYINASPEDAVKMPLPKYVPNANLYKKALTYLQDLGLEAEDFYFTKDKKFIVKQKNGDLIYDASYEAVRRALANDPMVQQAYAVDSYLKARRYAQNELDAGKVSSIDEGKVAWAQNTIADINFKAAELELTHQGKIDEAKKLRAQHEAHIASYGLDRLSPLEQRSYQDILMEAQELEKASDANKELLGAIGNLTSDTDGLVDKAYAMLMNWNISDDLRAAARTQSMVGASRDIEINAFQRDIEKHNLDMIRLNAQQAFDKEQNALNRANRLMAAQISATGKASPTTTPSSLKEALQTYNLGDGPKFSYVADEEGKPNADADILSMSEVELEKISQQTLTDQINIVLDFHQRTDPDHPEQIIIGGEVFSLQDASKELRKKENFEFLQQQYGKISEQLKTEESRAKYLPTFNLQDVAVFKDKLDRIEASVLVAENARGELERRVIDNWERVLEFEDLFGVKEVKEGLEYGAPSIVQNGRIISQEEYIAQAIDRARNREYTDRVRLDEDFYTRYSTTDKGLPSPSNFLNTIVATLNPRTTQAIMTTPMGSPQLDEAWVTEEATKEYNNQRAVINRTLNGFYNYDRTGDQDPNDEKPDTNFEAFGIYSMLSGGSLRDMTDETAFVSRSYSTPMLRGNTAENLDVVQSNVLLGLINQIQQGGTSFVAGDVGTMDQNELETKIENTASNAKTIMDVALQNLDAGYGEDKKNLFKVTYVDAYGAEDSPTKGGTYLIRFDDDFMDKVAAGNADAEGMNIINNAQRKEYSQISVLVDPGFDVSVFSFQNQAPSNIVDVAIQYNDSYSVDVPDAGSFKIWKDADGLTYKLQTEKLFFNPEAGTDNHYVSQKNPIITMRYPNKPEYGDKANQPVSSVDIQSFANHMRYKVLEEQLKRNKEAKDKYSENK